MSYVFVMPMFRNKIMETEKKDNKIKCLICGKAFVKPLAHAWQKHGINAREYKQSFGLDLKKGLIPEYHKEHLREQVKENYSKVVEKNLLKGGIKSRFSLGDKTIGKYTRSEQTMKRLKEHFDKEVFRKGKKAYVPKVEVKCAICGKAKMVYPRYVKEGNNYCGVSHRNIANNRKRKSNLKN